jgi:DNA end-binding protein Ku
MARPLWKGSIAFGLVNVPVKLYKATAPSSGHQIAFHQIHDKCGTRIKMKRWCPHDDREVAWQEIQKGYEYAKGRYTIITDEELAALPKPDEAAISIESFVDLSDVDPLYFDRGYYVSPDGAGKAYALLLKVLNETKRAAVAKMALRTRGHLALLRPNSDHLILHTMYFDEELADADQVPGAGKTHVTDKEVAMARELVEHMAGEWRPEAYKDDYTEKLREMIEKKIEGAEVVESPLPERGGEVVSLMDALRKSLGGEKRPQVRAAASHSRKRAAHHARHKKAS